MNDEEIKIEDEEELDEEAGQEDEGAAAGEELTPEQSWQKLLDNDGELAPSPADETPDNPETVTPADEKTSDVDPRLEALEQAGRAELELLSGGVPATDPAAQPRVESPAPTIPAPPAVVAPAKIKLPELIELEDGQRVKLDQVMEGIFGDEAQNAKAIFAALMAATGTPAAPPAPAPNLDDSPTVRSLRAELEHQKAVMATAAINPEIYAINARLPGSKNPHPFWEFLGQQSEGVRYKAEIGKPEDVAELITIWQDGERRRQAIKQVDEKKASAKARKDMVYRAVPSDRGGRSGGPRPMSDDEFNRLPKEEKQRLWQASLK